jgi:hypothetical protein
MLGLTESHRYYLYHRVAEMRKGLGGQRGIVMDQEWQSIGPVELVEGMAVCIFISIDAGTGQKCYSRSVLDSLCTIPKTICLILKYKEV